jgi:hypothetical protein
MRVRIYSAFDLADTSPENVRWIAILFVASDDTAFASNALRHVEMKAILLTGCGRSRHPALCSNSAERGFRCVRAIERYNLRCGDQAEDIAVFLNSREQG